MLSISGRGAGQRGVPAAGSRPGGRQVLLRCHGLQCGRLCLIGPGRSAPCGLELSAGVNSRSDRAFYTNMAHNCIACAQPHGTLCSYTEMSLCLCTEMSLCCRPDYNTVDILQRHTGVMQCRNRPACAQAGSGLAKCLAVSLPWYAELHAGQLKSTLGIAGTHLFPGVLAAAGSPGAGLLALKLAVGFILDS